MAGLRGVPLEADVHVVEDPCNIDLLAAILMAAMMMTMTTLMMARATMVTPVMMTVIRVLTMSITIMKTMPTRRGWRH